jgi:tetratricopeptide (TPR) repeat protein
MKARSIKAVLLAASLIFPTWSFAQTKSKEAAAYANSGIAKLKKNDFDGAIADFDRALQFDPKLAQAYDNRGNAKTEKGDFDGAIADFNRALQLNPKLVPAYEARGNAKREKYDLSVSGAVDEFVSPDYDLDPHKVDKGALDGAIADCNRAIELNPKLAGAYLNRGSAKAYKGDTDNAIADFNRALQLNPKLAPAYAGRGHANFLAHNWTAALRDYRRFCELSPRNQQYARFGIWMIRSRLGEREAADKELAAQFNAEGKNWP